MVFMSACLVRQCISDSMLKEINSFCEIKLKNFLCFAVNENLNIIQYVTKKEESFSLYKNLDKISVYFRILPPMIKR